MDPNVTAEETPAQTKARKLACALRTLALYRDDIKNAVGDERDFYRVVLALTRLQADAARSA